MEEPLEKLVEAVLNRPKYRRVCADLVRRIGARELEARRNFKEAVRATRNKLHQIGGAYCEGRLERAAESEWARTLAGLERTAGRADEFRQACRAAMRLHASTRERLPILDEFYALTLAGIPTPRIILDVACGLNPLAIPWMPLAGNGVYYACDIYTDMVEFLRHFFPLVGIEGHAEVRDVVHAPPTQRADVAFLLKTLPCLEQLDKTAGLRLLESLDARWLLVSFPVHSLGGSPKGMMEHYERHFRELVQGKPWNVQRFEFATELAFLVTKGHEGG